MRKDKTINGNHVKYGPSNVRNIRLYDEENLYLRVAAVVRVSFVSRELDIRFIDGQIPEENCVRAEVLFGSYAEPTGGTAEITDENKNAIEVIIPSAAVIGKGDRVVVLVNASRYYVLSKLDTFKYINNNTVAVYPGETLVKSLLGILTKVAFERDKEGEEGGYKESYLEFFDSKSNSVIKLNSKKPNKNKNVIPYYLLKTFVNAPASNINLIKLTTPGTYEMAGGGPHPVGPMYINKTIRHGRNVNGLPAILFSPFGKTDFSGSLSAYSSSEEKVHKKSCHPLLALPKENYYVGETILWFEDDEPEWVLAIVVYPSWELCKKIQFIEVPVYGWSKAALNNSINPEGEETPPPTEVDESDIVEYRRYEDQIRAVHTIERNWIDWNTVALSADYSSSFHKALCIPAIKTGPNEYKFVIQDGYGYSDGVTIFYGGNKQKFIKGSVKRTLRSSDLASNKSPYNYEITHDNPDAPSTNIDLGYVVAYKYYNDGDGDIWESQKTPPGEGGKLWKIFSDGVNTLYKSVNIDYYCDGQYSSYPWETGEEWSGDVETVTSFLNKVTEKIYWKGTGNPICEYKFEYEFEESIFTLTQDIPVFHYVNAEKGLLVIEFIQIKLRDLLENRFKIDTENSYHRRKFVVWYRGIQRTLFILNIPYIEGSYFPVVYNFWPWLHDAGTPQMPLTSPYNELINRKSIFYLSPFADYYVAPVAPYVFRAISYPTIQGDVSSVLLVSAKNYENEDSNINSDYLKVSLDPRDNSWCVRLLNVIALTGARTIEYPDGGGLLDSPNGGNTLICISGGTPTFSIPEASETVELD